MLNITGIGLVSSLGTDARTSLAAARAGITRCMVLRTVNADADEALAGGAVAGHSAACGLADGFVGRAKALLLGKAALVDLLEQTGPAMGRTGVYVVLSDYFLIDGTERKGGDEEGQDAAPSAVWRRATGDFVATLVADGPLASSEIQYLFYGGHAGIVHALEQARRDLEGGAVDTCVVGAIDSCIEPRMVRAAARARVLKTQAVSTGFFPGEAAAFVVVSAQAPKPSRRGQIAVSALGMADDARHSLSDDPPNGVGLAAAAESCLSQLAPDERSGIGLMISDLNGDERRALEWGYCFVRLQSRYGLGGARVWLPALSFGETGCASGALAICTAVRALQRNYAGTRHVAVLLSSDAGAKAALCLRA